jgi:hypothetical protein
MNACRESGGREGVQKRELESKKAKPLLECAGKNSYR